jgi:hypothetical protein
MLAVTQGPGNNSMKGGLTHTQVRQRKRRIEMKPKVLSDLWHAVGKHWIITTDMGNTSGVFEDISMLT